MNLFVSGRRQVLGVFGLVLVTYFVALCTAFSQETATESGFEVFQYGDVERQYVLHLLMIFQRMHHLYFFFMGIMATPVTMPRWA